MTSDTDRLRQAADHIDIAWDSMESHAPRWATEHDKVGRATAVLLRAVADESQLNPCRSETVVDAALALVDVILGGES